MCKFTMVNVNCRPKVPRQGPFFSITICFNVCGYCRLCRKFKRKCQNTSYKWGFTFCDRLIFAGTIIGSSGIPKLFSAKIIVYIAFIVNGAQHVFKDEIFISFLVSLFPSLG